MKKVFLAAAVVMAMASCNDESATSTTGTDVVTPNDSADKITTTPTSTGYAAGEGDVMYSNGKVMVWRNSQWVEADNDVMLDDGIVVRKNGRVVRADKEIELKEGQAVSRTGRFFDKAGNAIENTWEDVKDAAEDAGDGIKKGAKKAKEEVKDVFTKDEKKKDNN